MPCLLLALFLLFPRVALVLLYFFTTYLSRAYHSLLILILGFIFVPLTTLVYAFMINSNMPPEGINLLWLFIAVLVDLGFLGGGYRHQRSRA
jgi:uncharacterized oligopeptide transporter (OPT) family protein